MPDWWPLIKSNLLADTENILYVMVPVIAGLGYGDITLTTHPRKKADILLSFWLYSVLFSWAYPFSPLIIRNWPY